MQLGTGVLWLMDLSLPLDENVRQARESFRRHFHREPEYVHLNPTDVHLLGPSEDWTGEGIKTIMGIPVEAKVQTLKGHLFVGMAFIGN